MRKLTLFLSVFLLSLFYANAQECGTIDFPRVIPDSVCTSDTILMATDQEIGDNSFAGNGIYYNQAYYFSPQEADIGNRIYIKIYGQDTCNQFVQDSVSVFITDCSNCTPIKDPETVPDSICRSADRIRVASYYEGYGGPISVEGDGIVEISDNMTGRMQYWWYFYPDSIAGDEAHLTFIDSSTCEKHINKTIIMKDCSAPCETVSFINSLPDSVCKDSSNSIYLTSSAIYDAPISVTGKGVYAEAQNGGIDSAYYFDPSLINSSEYNQYFNIVIQAYDDCQSQAVESLMVYDCAPNNCDTLAEFANTIPDTVCNTDNSIIIADINDYQNIIPYGDYSYSNGRFYFNPSSVLVDTISTVGLKFFNACQDSFYVEQDVYVKDCRQCQDAEFASLPDTICINDTLIFLASTADYDFPISVDGESVVKLAINDSSDFEYYIDPSIITEDNIDYGYTVFEIRVEDDCNSWINDSISVLNCADSCKAFLEFENPLPDSICVNENAILLAKKNHYLTFEFDQNGIYENSYGVYFNPGSFNSDTTVNIELTAINYCDTFYVEEQIFVDDCEPDCRTPQFANALPNEICSDDSAIYLASTTDFNFPIKVRGEGVVAQSLNGGLDSAYYFDPSMVGGSLPQYPNIYITAQDDCRFYVQDSTIVSSCIDTCAIPTEFEHPLPDTICSSDDKILIASDGNFDYDDYYDYVVEEDNSYYFDPSLVLNTERNATVTLVGFKECTHYFEIDQEVYIQDCKIDSCVEFTEFLNQVPDTICNTDNPILLVNGDDFEDVIPFSPYIEQINGDFYFNPALSATDTIFSIGLKVFNACRDSFYVEQLVYVDDCTPDCGTPQFTNALTDEICSNVPRIYLTSTQAYDFSISVAGNGVVSEAINSGSDTAYYFDPASVNGSLPQYPLIMIRAEDDCRNFALDSTEVTTCLDSCNIVPEFPYPFPDSICYSTSPIILDLLNALDVWGDGIVYDGDIEFDPSVPALNHHAVVYASVENYCQEEVVVSDTVFIKPCKINAINDFSAEDISVFPNPVRDLLTVSGEGIKQVQLRDLTGKTVLIQENHKLDLSGLSKGIYFIQIELQNGKIITEKIVKE